MDNPNITKCPTCGSPVTSHYEPLVPVCTLGEWGDLQSQVNELTKELQVAREALEAARRRVKKYMGDDSVEAIIDEALAKRRGE